MNNSTKGWHSRGYLPHFDGDVFQFVTFRLYDSLPQNVLRRIEEEVARGEFDDKRREIRIRIENYLDAGIGKCILRQPNIAQIVEESLLFYDGKRYRLIAWVIMPNHIHLLIEPLDNVSLSSIMQSFKGFTARAINKLLGTSGHVWQPDYFDRYIRNQDHLYKTLRYIENNPVKAGLVENPENWPFGSARRNADFQVRELNKD